MRRIWSPGCDRSPHNPQSGVRKSENLFLRLKFKGPQPRQSGPRLSPNKHESAFFHLATARGWTPFFLGSQLLVGTLFGGSETIFGGQALLLGSKDPLRPKPQKQIRPSAGRKNTTALHPPLQIPTVLMMVLLGKKKKKKTCSPRVNTSFLVAS